jgi:parvulin-like peptidyl-prolyl isomerase
MAKRKEEAPREETRKQTHIKRREAEMNRRILIALAAVGVLLLILIGVGVLQELFITPNQPVVTINGDRVSTRDYQKLVKYAWYQQNLQGQPVTDPQGTSLQVLDDAVDNALIEEQAQQRNITVSDDEITQQIETYFGYYRVPPTPFPTVTPAPTATVDPAATEPTATPAPTMTPAPTATPVSQEAYQTAYQDYLRRLNTATGMTESDFRQMVRQDLLRQKLYEDVTKDTPATAEQVNAQHILVAIRTPAPTATPTTEGGPTATPTAEGAPTATPTPEPRDDAQALALITEIRQRIDAGEDFAALAKQYSDDPGSKEQGGELGWFARDMGLVKEFEDAAFQLQAGEISQPVKTQFGYHLIKVLERDPARPLEEYFVQQKQAEAWQAWLTQQRDAAQVERRWTLDKVPPTPSGVSSRG